MYESSGVGVVLWRCPLNGGGVMWINSFVLKVFLIDLKGVVEGPCSLMIRLCLQAKSSQIVSASVSEY